MQAVLYRESVSKTWKSHVREKNLTVACLTVPSRIKNAKREVRRVMHFAEAAMAMAVANLPHFFF